MKIRKTTPFLPHLLITLLTLGLWLPVWLFLLAYRALSPAYKGA